MAIRRLKTGNMFLTSSELSEFCLQTSMILKAGIPLHEGLALLIEDRTDSRLSNILSMISQNVSTGSQLYEALIKTGAFPDYLVNMVRIGSDSGKLDDVLFSLSTYYDREHGLKQTIRSAVVYPMVLVIMMLIVMLVLSIKVLPIFEQVFQSLGTNLSPSASAIMQLGLTFSKYSVILLILVAIILIVLILLSKAGRGKSLIARIAATGALSEKIAMSRFSSSMSLMLSSGLDTEHALQLSSTVVENKIVKDKIDRCLALIKEQHSATDAIAAVKLYPPMILRTIFLGFQAGNLDQVMHQIAEAAEEEIDSSLTRRVGLIEPISIGILAVVIGIILISVMLPLMSVMSSIG